MRISPALRSSAFLPSVLAMPYYLGVNPVEDLSVSPVPALSREVVVSVVLPCLNEAAGVGTCVEKVRRALDEMGVPGEVVVVANGSTDGSGEIATRAGARVVHERRRGYGAAYLRGFQEARGRYLVMGDADDTYDFSE